MHLVVVQAVPKLRNEREPLKRPADVDGRRLVVKQSKERIKRLRWFAVACRPELTRGLAGGEDIAGAQMELMVTDNAGAWRRFRRLNPTEPCMRLQS